MRRIISVIALAALAGACGSDDSAPSLSDTLTESTWVTSAEAYHVYLDDGTYNVSFNRATAEGVDQAEGQDENTPDPELLEWGTWTLESDVLTLVPDAQSPSCADIIGVYQLDVIDDGTRIDVTVQDDTCEGRSSDVSMGLTQAEP
jgi:hypothetical protein